VLHGAFNRLPADDSVAGNRDARSVFNVVGQWERQENDWWKVAWARRPWQGLKRSPTGGNYVNFPTEEESDHRIRSANGGNYEGGTGEGRVGSDQRLPRRDPVS
jgi:hypothetical protein